MNNEKTKTKSSGAFWKCIEALVYLAIVNFSYLIVFYVDVTEKYTSSNVDAYKSIWYILTIIALGILMFNRMFHTLKLSKTENVLIIVSSTIMIAFTIVILAFVYRSFAIPRSVILLGFFIQTFLFIAIKFLIKYIYNKRKRKKNVAIFCSKEDIESIIENLFGGKNIDEKIEFVSTKSFYEVDSNLLNGLDKIYFSNTYKSRLLDEHLHNIVLKGIQICIVPSSYDLAITNASFYLTSDVPLLRIDQIGFSVEHRIIKRAIDILFSLIGLILTMPIIIVVYIAIYLDGKNVIYKQKRVTYNNKVFTVYKFRTMIINAEKDTGAVWASDNDPRITKLGMFLRKYWLDELPQLFNVLKGDMSIVGPRPERPELIEEFVENYPDFKLRTLVKCGITGYAQVMAKYDTTPQNKLKFDLFYILNASLFFDINIMVMTARKMLLRFFHHEKPYKKYGEIIKLMNIKNINDEDGIIYITYK